MGAELGINVGYSDGVSLGSLVVGEKLGVPVVGALVVGFIEGSPVVGLIVGTGAGVGIAVDGELLGTTLGIAVVGLEDGISVGANVSSAPVGDDDVDGPAVGMVVGAGVAADIEANPDEVGSIVVSVVGVSPKSSPMLVPSCALLLALLLLSLLLLSRLLLRALVPKLTPNKIATSKSRTTSSLLLNELNIGPPERDDASPEESADIGDRIGLPGLSYGVGSFSAMPSRPTSTLSASSRSFP